MTEDTTDLESQLRPEEVQSQASERQRREYVSWRCREIIPLLYAYMWLLSSLAFTVSAILLQSKLQSLRDASGAGGPLDTTLDIGFSWTTVLSPVWAADIVFVCCSGALLYVVGNDLTRNPRINGFMVIMKCSLGAIFKLLLLLRLNSGVGPWRVVCAPYYIALVLQYMMHYCKENGRNGRRPGSPISISQIMAILITNKLDNLSGYEDYSWALVFTPVWCFYIILLGILCIGLCVAPLLFRALVSQSNAILTRRLLVFGYVYLLTYCVPALASLVQLVNWLDDESAPPIPVHRIMMSYIIGSCVSMLFLVALVRTMQQLSQANFLQTSDEETQEPIEDVTSLFSDAIKPKALVRESSTLFRRASQQTLSKYDQADGFDSPSSKLESSELVHVQDSNCDLGEGEGGEVGPDECWICCQQPQEAAFLECGHGGVCWECAVKTFQKQNKRCPMCRKQISQIIRMSGDIQTVDGQVLVVVEQ